MLYRFVVITTRALNICYYCCYSSQYLIVSFGLLLVLKVCLYIKIRISSTKMLFKLDSSQCDLISVDILHDIYLL